MEQIVRVHRLRPDGKADIILVRESACSGDCHKCSGCGAQKETMIVTAENPIRAEDECRSVIIQNYFGDKEATPCGVCDVCLRAKRMARDGGDDCERRVVEVLSCREMDIKALVTELGLDGERVVEIVDKMVREGKILLSERGKLKIIQ